MSLRLLKVEEGLFKGEVLYHALVQKTDEEKAALRSKIQNKEDTKIKNKRIQDQNVKRKEEVKEEKLLKKRSKNPTENKGEEDNEEENYDFLV